MDFFALTPQKNKTAVTNAEEIRQVSIDRIRVNPFQPRRHFSIEELQELAASIQTVGLIHPPAVRVLQEDPDSYEIISGERRWRAAQMAGFQTISVVVRQYSTELSAEAALIENIQRVDLNPLEIAKAMKCLMLELRLNQDQLAQRIGKKRSTVANYLRLLTLPDEIKESLAKDHITMGHAKAILSLDRIHDQLRLYQAIVNHAWSVREAEAAAGRMMQKLEKPAPIEMTRDFYLEMLAEKVQQKLGTKVAIHGNGAKGKITIDYYNLDDLDRVLQALGVSF